MGGHRDSGSQLACSALWLGLDWVKIRFRVMIMIRVRGRVGFGDRAGIRLGLWLV